MQFSSYGDSMLDKQEEVIDLFYLKSKARQTSGYPQMTTKPDQDIHQFFLSGRDPDGALLRWHPSIPIAIPGGRTMTGSS
jgi:hypothetical protein